MHFTRSTELFSVFFQRTKLNDIKWKEEIVFFFVSCYANYASIERRTSQECIVELCTFHILGGRKARIENTDTIASEIRQ
jgi:hypothetical protein